MSYEKMLERIEEIVTKLEKEALPIDESLKLYEEAGELVKKCYEK